MSSYVTLNVDATADGRRFRLSCVHGASAALMLLDRPAAPADVVVDILFARHRSARACTCSWPTVAAAGASPDAEARKEASA